MDKNFVLVSFIGRNSNKYDTVDYLLPENDEKIYTNDTSIALIKSKKQHWNITKAIIIGTYTSNWFELVSESDAKDLYDDLAEICREETDENIGRLEDVLGRLVDYFSRCYGIKLEPIVHRSDLSFDTIAEIADGYDTHVFDLIKGYSNILIDITHGYRHMPILLFQIFQQPFILTNGGPLNATYTISMHLYNNGFLYGKMGYASMLAWGLFIVIMVITLIVQLSSKHWVFYDD